EAVVRGLVDRSYERLCRVVVPHLGEPAQRNGPAQAGALLERLGIVRERRAGGCELALLRQRGDVNGALSARRTMSGQCPALLGRRDGLVVDGDLAWAAEHADMVLGLADLDGLADELVGHGVNVAIDVDVALEVD